MKKKPSLGTFCPISRWIVALVWQEFVKDKAAGKDRRWSSMTAFARECFPESSAASAAVIFLRLVKGAYGQNRIPVLTVCEAKSLARTIGRDLSEIVFKAERLYAEGAAFPEDVAYDHPLPPKYNRQNI